jgi:hypothetical protein
MKHKGRADKTPFKKYQRLSIKYIKYSNHLKYLTKCNDERLVPKCLRITKKFNVIKAKKIIQRTELILLRSLIAEVRRKLFQLKRNVNRARDALKTSCTEMEFETCMDLVNRIVLRYTCGE